MPVEGLPAANVAIEGSASAHKRKNEIGFMGCNYHESRGEGKHTIAPAPRASRYSHWIAAASEPYVRRGGAWMQRAILTSRTGSWLGVAAGAPLAVEMGIRAGGLSFGRRHQFRAPSRRAVGRLLVESNDVNGFGDDGLDPTNVNPGEFIDGDRHARYRGCLLARARRRVCLLG